MKFQVRWTNLKRPVVVGFPRPIHNLIKVEIACLGSYRTLIKSLMGGEKVEIRKWKMNFFNKLGLLPLSIFQLIFALHIPIKSLIESWFWLTWNWAAALMSAEPVRPFTKNGKLRVVSSTAFIENTNRLPETCVYITNASPKIWNL